MITSILLRLVGLGSVTWRNNTNDCFFQCHPSTWIAPAHHLQVMYESYDRLAFLGDSLIGRDIVEMLIDEYYCVTNVMAVSIKFIPPDIIPI